MKQDEVVWDGGYFSSLCLSFQKESIGELETFKVIASTY
jgi:hypothetical protein